MDIKRMNEVKEEAITLLQQNPEWEDKYAQYANDILQNIKLIENNKSKFHQFSPLFLYMAIGEAQTSASKFSLRYMGQAVASLAVKRDGKITINATQKITKSNSDYFEWPTELHNAEWDKTEAQNFRRHFIKEIKADLSPRQCEHKYESMILTEMEKNDKATKFQGTFSGLQPVKIAGVCRFQMCTPIKASQKNLTAYNKDKGGGIDMLARLGVGNPCLSVIELKKPGSGSVQDTMEQGIAYTTFLVKLLRSKSGQDWYNIFEYKRKLPAKLALNCVVAMGKGNKFDPQTLPIGNDEIRLHYMYYEERDKGIAITDTSLPRSE